MARLRYDEFDDGIVAGFWDISDSGGGATTESEGKLQMTMQAGGQCVAEQSLASNPAPLDIWTKLQMPEGSYSGGYPDQQFNIYDDDGDIGIALHYEDSSSSWKVWAWADVDGWSYYSDTGPDHIAIGQNYVYVRLRTTASGGNIYYSLTQPTQDSDWTEIVFPGDWNGYNEMPQPWSPSTNFAVFMSANPDAQAVDKTYTFEFVREWPVTSTSNRVRSRQLKLDSTTPVKVSDMKDGEMLMTSDGLYARVGDQVLQKNLPAAVTGIIGTYFDIGPGEGHILRSAKESLGATWVDIGGGHSPNQEDIGAVVSCGDGIWLALTQWTAMHVLKSVDNGLTWQDKGAVPVETYEAYTIAYLGNGIVVIGASDPGGRIYRSIDYGDNWVDLGVQIAGSPYIWDIEYLEGGIVLAGTDSGIYARSEDYGATWQEMAPMSAAATELNCFVYLGDGIVVAATDDGPYKSYDYGLNWERKGSFYAWAMVHLGNGVLVVSDATVAWRSTDGGESWTDLGAIPNADDFWKMAHLGGDIIVGGNWGNRYLARTIDAGENWTNLPLITDHGWTEAAASDIKVVDWEEDGNLKVILSGTDDGGVDNYENGAANWSLLHDATDGDSINLNPAFYQAPVVNYDSGFEDWYLRRTFIHFDLDNLSGKQIVGAELHVRGWTEGSGDPCSVQQGTHAIPPTTADYDSFTGTLFGLVSSWAISDWNVFTLNGLGVDYLNSIIGNIAKLCLREYDYDYLNVDPGGGSVNSDPSMYFYNSDFAPFLKLTLADATTTTTTTTT